MKIFGRVIIMPADGVRWTWEIALRISHDRRREDAIVGTHWAYLTQVAARVAARRWMDRLSIVPLDESEPEEESHE